MSFFDFIENLSDRTGWNKTSQLLVVSQAIDEVLETSAREKIMDALQAMADAEEAQDYCVECDAPVFPPETCLDSDGLCTFCAEEANESEFYDKAPGYDA
jgi:hypothetical protein